MNDTSSEQPLMDGQPSPGSAGSDRPAAGSKTPNDSPAGTKLGRALGGDLKCIVCGYNLKGISIRGRCPECGVRIRATILAIVDPLANELRPIRKKRLVACGLVVWAVSAALAAMLGWLPHAFDAVVWTGLTRSPRPNVGLGLAGLILLSAIGALGFARPHAGVPVRTTLACLAGSALCVPLAWTIWKIHEQAADGPGWKYVHGWRPSTGDAILGVAASLLIAASLLLIRPVIRLLVARSLVMRTGRVDRQTMYAMAGAAAIVAVGHGLSYWSVPGSTAGDTVLRSISLAFIAFGSLLLTLGFAGGVLDAVRIAGAVLLPSPTLHAVIREGHDPGSALIALTSRTPREPAAGGQVASAGNKPPTAP